MSPMLLHNMVIRKWTILHMTHKYGSIPSCKVEIITDELDQTSRCVIRGGADKSLAQPTSQCRRKESWKTAGFRLNQ
jgi:hypothetical protein